MAEIPTYLFNLAQHNRIFDSISQMHKMQTQKLPFDPEFLLQKIELGEDSFTQFKVKLENIVSISEELVAFANSGGGIIIVGVSDKGEIIGLEKTEIQALNQRISNAGSENCNPPVYPKTQTIALDGRNIVIIEVEDGLQKPYQTKQGKYLTKAGSDKRLLSNEEMKRMILTKNILFEELPVDGSSIEKDLSILAFSTYFQKSFQTDYESFIESENQTLDQLLDNLLITQNKQFTTAGLLFFAKNVQRLRPLFLVRAVAYYGNDITDQEYISSDNFEGNLVEQYERSLNFIKQNLRRVQKDQSFNSIGELEIPQIVFEELLVNALVHRDYSVNSAIRLLIFKNRIEIISPGVLPNHLTEANVRMGVHVPRNPLIQRMASHLLPYRGLGSGIQRAIKNYSEIELNNNHLKQEFKIIINRNEF